MDRQELPPGIKLAVDVGYRADRPTPYRARVRWTDPSTKKRHSRSEAFATDDEAQAWLKRMERAASRGVTPATAAMTLAEYGAEDAEVSSPGFDGEWVSWLSGVFLVRWSLRGGLRTRRVGRGRVRRGGVAG
jgi:hypothetical protein